MNSSLVEFLKQENFAYARTVRNFNFKRCGFTHDPSIQYYPHGPFALLANKLKQTFKLDHRFLGYFFSSDSLNERLFRAAAYSHDDNKYEYFHVWGHSWEIEAISSVAY